MSSVHMQLESNVHWTSHFLEGTRKTRPCLTGNVAISPIHARYCAIIFKQHIDGRWQVYIEYNISEGFSHPFNEMT